MNTLFTTIHGSKLYGTNTPQSDTDYKSVFLPPIKQLLRGEKVSNSVKTTNGTGKNTSIDEDYEYIPLQVLCKDFVNGQIYAQELVFAALQPNEHTLEIKNHFRTTCMELVDGFLTSNVTSMVGYAMGQATKYGIKGTRLNSLRTVHNVFSKYEHLPDAKIQDLQCLVGELEALADSDRYCETRLYNGPRTEDVSNPVDPAFVLLEKVFGYEITITECLKRTSSMLKKYGARTNQASIQNGHDWKAISHALRIIDQAYEVLTHHTLSFPLPDAAYYTEVKLGQHTWEEVSEELAKRLERMERAQLTTTLPKADDKFMNRFYSWFDWTMARYYGI